jgi:ATP-dependent Lon protease
METIRLAGYLTEEKVAIAKHHLWPKQLGKAGLKKAQLKLSDAVLRRLIDGYAREAGVRVLDQLLGRLVRKAVVQFLEQGIDRLVIDQGLLTEWLGAPIFQKQVPQQGMGVVNGLAWTALGGTTLSIEATRVPGQGRGFKQTGQLGSVMQESAQIAYSYVAGAAGAFGIKPGFFDEAFIHLHVPEGATPKDGPSAGITMATALVSLATNRTMKKHIAMTGELTLTGRVLPVGGIREKVIAAKRAGIKTVLLPEANRRDFDEMPDYLKPGLSVHFVSQFDEVAALVF